MNERICIESLNDLDFEKRRKEIRRIFFKTTSRRDFSSEQEKEEFFSSWTDYYFQNWPEDVLLALDTSDKNTVGYLTGCRNSEKAKDTLGPRVPSYLTFEDQFSDFPAHLHINVSPNCQGQGVGALLVENYVQRLKDSGVPGLHIVTGADSRNVRFYQRNGFDFEIERFFNSSKLRFMGKKLSSLE